VVRPPDGPPGPISGVVADPNGGLLLADPAGLRILQVAPDGSLLRELRDPTGSGLAGVRGLELTADGDRLFALNASGVVTMDLPRLNSP
jgi:hypothetical protein